MAEVGFYLTVFGESIVDQRSRVCSTYPYVYVPLENWIQIMKKPKLKVHGCDFPNTKL